MSSSNSYPKRVALTGGIGCGKTTVLKEFRRLGVPCFMADEVAGAYYAEDGFKTEIRQMFGDSVFDGQGNVDKKLVADIVFNDQEKLARLNALVHPRIKADFEQWTQKQESVYVVLECAILYEAGFDTLVDKVVCVYIDESERLTRLLERDQTTVESIKSRMRHQLPAEEKMDRADWVILNYEGNPRSRQVAYIDKKIREI